MSTPLTHPRARRRTRLGLFAPAAVLFLVLAVSAAGWLWARSRLISEMDARAGALRQAGWTASWAERTISGFPFRLKIVLTDVRLRAAGDRAWGVNTPSLEAQAYVVEPTHWVFAAPQGLTILRPLGGPLVVTGEALRASVAGVGKTPWRIAIEGVGLRFAPAAGAKPFSFTAMQRFEAHLRPSADGSGDGDALVTMDGGQAAPESFLTRLAPGALITLAASGRLTKLAQAKRGDWSSAVAAWAQAGGALRIDRLSGVGGPLRVASEGAILGVDARGYLEGAIPLAMTEAPEAAPAARPVPPAQADAAAGKSVALPVVFREGRMALGPADVGEAPRLR